MSSGASSNTTTNGTSEKNCKACGHMLPLTSFSPHLSSADRHHAKCKVCRAREKREGREVGSLDTPPAKRQQLEAPARGEHLYVMAFSTDPEGHMNGFKIGRSNDVARRALELAVQMPYHMLVLANFMGQGHLEDAVHSMLAPLRNAGGRGREWFYSPLPDILHAVGCAMQARPYVNGSATGSAQQRPWPPGNSTPVAGGEEEGAYHYEDGSGDLCEGEGFQADLSSGSAGEGEHCGREP